MRPLFSLSPSPSPLIALDTARARSCGLVTISGGEMRSASDPIVGASVGPQAFFSSPGQPCDQHGLGQDLLSCG